MRLGWASVLGGWTWTGWAGGLAGRLGWAYEALVRRTASLRKGGLRVDDLHGAYAIVREVSEEPPERGLPTLRRDVLEDDVGVDEVELTFEAAEVEEIEARLRALGYGD